jgi:chorismate dehydratase
MSAFPHLQRLKIGCVQYLNSAPLICAYDGEVLFDHPARLAARLAEGVLDVALVPVFEWFRQPEYKAADGISISSRGEVFSVFLAYRGDLSGVKRIFTDPASLTSASLLRCILAEFQGITPEYRAGEGGEGAARLLIGNQAIDFRRAHPADYQYLDLGGEWTARTGLPFVYALWLFGPRVKNAGPAAEELRRLKKTGITRLAEICREDTAFRLHYLRHCIRYDLGEAEKAGIRRFGGLLEKHGLAQAPASGLEFV